MKYLWYWYQPMARAGYVTVALPEELVKEIDAVIRNKKRGYTSRGEFVKEACRNLLKGL